MKKKELEFTFQYASLTLTPYSKEDKSSSDLLREVFREFKNLKPIEKYLNRYKDRKNTQPRHLINVASRFENKDGVTRLIGRMALIKNKAPKLLTSKGEIEDIVKGQKKEFVELTNYVVNFNHNSDPVIMIEFNSAGARLSDIEWYWRQFSRDKKIATSLKAVYHLKLNYDQLEDHISNIFNISVKVKTNKLIHSKEIEWFKPLQTLSEDTGYKDVRLEFSYGRAKEPSGNFLRNTRGLKLARNVLNWLRKNDKNIENVEDLKMTYEVDKNMEVIDTDFLKNKDTSYVYIPIDKEGHFNRKDFNFQVGQEFNMYLREGKTTEMKKTEE